MNRSVTTTSDSAAFALASGAQLLGPPASVRLAGALRMAFSGKGLVRSGIGALPAAGLIADAAGLMLRGF